MKRSTKDIVNALMKLVFVVVLAVAAYMVLFAVAHIVFLCYQFGLEKTACFVIIIAGLKYIITGGRK